MKSFLFSQPKLSPIYQNGASAKMYTINAGHEKLFKDFNYLTIDCHPYPMCPNPTTFQSLPRT